MISPSSSILVGDARNQGVVPAHPRPMGRFWMPWDGAMKQQGSTHQRDGLHPLDTDIAKQEESPRVIKMDVGAKWGFGGRRSVSESYQSRLVLQPLMSTPSALQINPLLPRKPA
jgi:hypothetical protein